MTQSTSTIAVQPVRRVVTRAALAGARSWTGRSVVTNATDRVQPRYVTLAMHRTRVSGMRYTASRASVVRAFRARTAPETTSSTRRRLTSASSGG